MNVFTHSMRPTTATVTMLQLNRRPHRQHYQISVDNCRPRWASNSKKRATTIATAVRRMHHGRCKLNLYKPETLAYMNAKLAPNRKLAPEYICMLSVSTQLSAIQSLALSFFSFLLFKLNSCLFVSRFARDINCIHVWRIFSFCFRVSGDFVTGLIPIH